MLLLIVAVVLAGLALWQARRLWNGLTILATALWPTAVALTLIVAGAVLLLVHEQGRDLAIRLVERSASWGDWVLFFLATAWWAVQSWLWSRIALNQRFGPLQPPPSTLPVRLLDGKVVDSKSLDWLVRVIPRAYALAVFALAAWAIWNAGGDKTYAGWGYLIAGVVLASILWKRRRLFDPLRHLAQSLSAQAVHLATPLGGANTLVSAPRRAGRTVAAASLGLMAGAANLAAPVATTPDSLFGATSVGRFLTRSALVLALLIAVGVWWWPGAQAVGVFLGAASGTFLAFSSILAVLGLASGLSRRTGVPIVASLLILGGAVSLLIPSFIRDHHVIPVVSKATDGRRPLETAWKDWRTANPGPQQTPIVFVATAGGGVRAALWTAVVLDRARQTDAAFDRRLFAVSGVSGGALGAASYIAGLSSGAAGPPGPCASSGQNLGLCSYGQLGRQMFQADMLGPTFAAAFYGDLLFTFMPLPTPTDSAIALAESWHKAWDGGASAARGSFSQPFLTHWKGPGWRPVLLLNGTHVESGKRLITTDLSLATTTVRDAWDLHTIVGGDIDTAMAALNAARFPGVVAAGTVTTGDGVPWGHVIDGGYFENSGALTAVELAADVARIAGPAKLRAIFIEIVSDPGLIQRDFDRSHSLAACDAKGVGTPACDNGGLINFLIGLSGPLKGILNVRSGHGVWTPRHFADEAERLFPGANSTFVQFRLCPPAKAATVPLGWQLSTGSAEDIVRSLPAATPPQREPYASDLRWQCEMDNAAELERLKAALH